jgi:phosphatidate cytidylyltransferase
MSNFWQRTLTGAVFVGVILGAIYGGPLTFRLLLISINILCIYEYASLFKERSLNPSIPILLTCSIAMILLIGLGSMGTSFGFNSSILPGWHTTIYGPFAVLSPMFPFLVVLLMVPLIGELFRQKPDPFIRGVIGSGGLAYITFSLLLYAFIVNSIQGYNAHIAASIFYLVWASDTFAYLSGRTFGRTPLFPVVSPKKTWEGSIGGTIGATGIAVLLYYTVGIFTLPQWVGLAVVIVIFGTIGDLIESMLKRSLGLKDSGNILPGHGGVLDRFDAFLFVVPFVATYFVLIWSS